MSGNWRVGCRVEVMDKQLVGRIAFVGMTKFAKGRWIGIELDEPKGKNNGTVENQSYFSCPDQHGLFIKYENAKLKLLEDAPRMSDSMSSSMSSSGGLVSCIKPPSSAGSRGSRGNLSSAGSERNLAGLADARGSRTPTTSAIPTTQVRSIVRPGTMSRQNSNLTRTKQQQQQQQLSQQAVINTVETISQQTAVFATSSSTSDFVQQPLAAARLSISSGGSLSTVQSSAASPSGAEMGELKNLRSENADLKDKLETLKMKRLDERREHERLRIQVEQLTEFKLQITESHSELNRRLQQAERERREAIEEMNRHADEMKDLSETAEMATLDKEMAEEKCDSFARELEALKEQYEHVKLDYDILKEEVETVGPSEAAANHDLQRLQKQNDLLHEACTKLRDLQLEDKNAIARLNKELESVIQEKRTLEDSKKSNRRDIEAYEQQITELKEQVDFAMGAQEMVERLTERNLQLEEELGKLREELITLENLNDVNELLQESARETELELKSEIERMMIESQKLLNRLDENQEALADYESTIQKQRDVIARMKRENDNLRQQTNSDVQNREEEKQKLAQAENLQFKMRFAEAKVFTRAIEMDLRRLEVSQAKEYIKYLSLFMPDSFFICGGDNDAIQILLFIPRMIAKLNIISRQIVEKYPLNLEIEERLNSTFMFHEIEMVGQQVFVRRVLFLISSFETILSQYQDSLRSCSLELYLRIASLLPELTIHEKTIDNCIDLLKRDQFDETVSLESIYKSLQYFINLYNLHLADSKVNDCAKLLGNYILLLKSAVDALIMDLSVVRSCIQNEINNEKLEHFTLLQSAFSEIRALIKKIKRRLVGEQRLKLTSSIETDVRDSIFKINKLASVLARWRMCSLKQCKHIKSQSTNELDLPLVPYSQIEELIQNYGGVELIKQQLSSITSVCIALTSGLQQGDYDEVNANSFNTVDEQPNSISSLNSFEVKNPLEQRAEMIKAQSGQINELKIKLEAKHADLNEMKNLLKAKNEEWQQMKIRKDLAENKSLKATQEADERVAKLQNEIDDLKNTLKRREKEYEETMSAMQLDIENYETEKKDMKERIKQLSKKASLDGSFTHMPLTPSLSLHATTAAFSGMTSLATISSSISTTTSNLSAIENSYLAQMKVLRKALGMCSDELYQLKTQKYLARMKPMAKLSHHKPLWLLRAEGKLQDGQEPEGNFYVDLDRLLKQIRQLEKEAKLAILEECRLNPKMPITMQLAEDRLRRKLLLAKYIDLQNQVEKFKATYLNDASSGFKDALPLLFDSNEWSSSGVLAAKLTVPKKHAQQSITVSIDVTIQQLRKLHQGLI